MKILTLSITFLADEADLETELKDFLDENYTVRDILGCADADQPVIITMRDDKTGRVVSKTFNEPPSLR